MLDVAHDVVALHTTDQMSHHGTGQQRVFTGVFEQPAIARIAGQIHAAADGLVVALSAQLPANHIAVQVRAVQVP